MELWKWNVYSLLISIKLIAHQTKEDNKRQETKYKKKQGKQWINSDLVPYS